MDTNQSEVMRKMRQVVFQEDFTKGDMIHTATPNISPRTGYRKQGGTLIHINKKWASIGIEKHKDKYGRWCSVTLTGDKNRKITVINAYRVGNNTIEKAGGSTVWFQEYTLLLENGLKNPDPQQQILDDMEQYINDIKEDPDHEFVIFIDANEST